jgi:hypothetical protein
MLDEAEAESESGCGVVVHEELMRRLKKRLHAADMNFS